jgi:acyl-CoA thioesterase FadM
VDFYKGDELLAQGKLTSVCVAHGDGSFKAISIPEALRKKLGN